MQVTQQLVMVGRPREVRDDPDSADPDDARKPESPTDLSKPSVWFVLRKTAREFSRDQCTDLAAALTYYAVLSLFPALLAVVSLLGVFGQGQKTTDAVLKMVDDLGISGRGRRSPTACCRRMTLADTSSGTACARCARSQWAGWVHDDGGLMGTLIRSAARPTSSGCALGEALSPN